MKRQAFSTLTGSRTFRVVAMSLLVVMVVDVPARAVAQAAAPPAAAQSTAAKLANVPDSIPYDANPNPNVAPTRTMWIDIKTALDNAGISPEGRGTFDETPTADTVTFEGAEPDGDVIVTGKLVNGRIVLTKQLKPLLPSGDLGPAVTIAYKPTSTASGASASPAPATTGRGSTPVPAGAPPLPPEVIRKANLELEQHYKAEAAKIEGPFVVTGPGETMGTTKDVPASLPVVIGLLIVRDLYYAMLMAYARYLRQLKKLPDEQKRALVEKLIAAAPRLKAAYDELQVEERRARMMERAHYETSYARYSAAAEYWERKGNFEQADWYRKKADATRWGEFLQLREKFVDLLGENKDHQLLSLFRDTWAVGDEGFLFEYFADPPATAEERVAMFDEFLTINYTDLETEAADAKGVKTFVELKRFLEPKYDRVREAAQLVTASSGVSLPGQSVNALGDIYQSETLANIAKQTAIDVVIGIALLIALVWLPVLGPVLNAGYAGFQVIKEGNELRIAWVRVDEAKRSAGVTGQEQVFTEEDKQQAQLEKFFITAGMAISEVKTGGDAAPRLGQQVRQRLARRRSQSNTPAPATVPSGAATGAPSATAATGEVDRAAQTAIDLPAARADADTIGAVRQQVAQDLQQIDRQLAAAQPADRVRLHRQQQELRTRLLQLDEEVLQLNALIARGEAAGVDRAAVTTADPNALREEFADLSQRQNAIELELAGVSARAMRDPRLRPQQQALEKQLDAIIAERQALSARINRAEFDALENLTPEQAAQRAFALNEEGIQLTARRNALRDQIAKETDPLRRAQLQTEFDENGNRLASLIEEFSRVRGVAMRELDAAEAEIAREALDQEMELALKAGIPKSRVDELTQGYVPGKTDDLEQLGAMTDRLLEERVVKQPILDINNPDHADLIPLAIQEAGLIRGGLARARETGRLPDDLQEFLSAEIAKDPQYLDKLGGRYLTGGATVLSHERYPLVQKELIDELKAYYKPPDPRTGVAAQKAAEVIKTAAERGAAATGTPRLPARNEIRDQQQDAATRALLGDTSLFDGPVGSTAAEEIASLDKSILADGARLGQLVLRAFGSGIGSAEARVARNEFFVVEARLGANLAVRRLLRRETGTAPTPAGAGTTAPPAGTGTPTPPATTGKGEKEVGLNIPFADSVPEGPVFAISGEDKLKKDDAPSTVTGSPSIVRLDGTNAHTFNPVILHNGLRLLLVQYIAAEGQQLTVPGVSEPAKEPPFVRAPEWWHARPMLERLTALLVPPQIRAHRRGEPAGLSGAPPARGAPGTSQPAAASAPPIKIILTSLGRSSGDAFDMTVLNEGPAPVTLTGDAFVLEPVAEVTGAAVDKELAPLRGAGRAKTTLKAYCLEFLKQRPSAGMLFRFAPEDVQRRFGRVAHIFAASRKLRDQGKLQPGPGDPSNPASYFDDIRQWAIWTQEQKFDEKGYTRAFTDHSRKNVEAAGHTWTRELENAFAGLASGRWQAVQMVLREATAAR